MLEVLNRAIIANLAARVAVGFSLPTRRPGSS
jgi:hypothetical protein